MTVSAATGPASESPIGDVLGALQDFIEKRVLPLEDRHHQVLHDPLQLHDPVTGRYSGPAQELMRGVRVESAQAGFYTLQSPTSIGGGALGALDSYLLWRFLHREYGADYRLPYSTVAHWTSGPSHLCEHLSPSLQQSVLPALLSGEATACFGMSEAGAGSDARAMRTTAELHGDEWVLNGEKMWITHSPTATYAFVFARTSLADAHSTQSEISCFLVPCDAPGFQVESVIRFFGHVGGNEGILSLNSVTVPYENLLGNVGQGLTLAMKSVNLGRMYNAGRSVGLGQWALSRAIDHTRQRKAFGHHLADFQGVSFQLADSAIELYAADAAAAACATELDAGGDASTSLAMTKAFTTEVGFRVLDRAMQVHGAMGFTNELGLYDGWLETRVIRVADGSAEVMRRNIARSLIKGHYTV